MRCFFAALAIVSLTGQAATAAPVAEDEFVLRTTGDLVDLCTSDQSDRLYTAAQNFCYGFVVGTYRTLAAVDQGLRPKAKWFCEPSPAPSRSQAIAAFVTWARFTTGVLALSPTDGMFKYLTTVDRCK
jgi:hypothetical protein